MHNQNPPLIHRDLKIENLLFIVSDSGEPIRFINVDGSPAKKSSPKEKRFLCKLCDFGSATTTFMKPRSQQEILLCEENIAKFTTPVYRAPEMVDLYRKKKINEKVDVWALGCLLYKMAFLDSPFEEGSPLQILNVSYKIPDDSPYTAKISELIKFLLNPDPVKRPSIFTVHARVANELGIESTIKKKKFSAAKKIKPKKFGVVKDISECLTDDEDISGGNDDRRDNEVDSDIMEIGKKNKKCKKNKKVKRLEKKKARAIAKSNRAKDKEVQEQQVDSELKRKKSKSHISRKKPKSLHSSGSANSVLQALDWLPNESTNATTAEAVALPKSKKKKKKDKNNGKKTKKKKEKSFTDRSPLSARPRRAKITHKRSESVSNKKTVVNTSPEPNLFALKSTSVRNRRKARQQQAAEPNTGRVPVARQLFPQRQPQLSPLAQRRTTGCNVPLSRSSPGVLVKRQQQFNNVNTTAATLAVPTTNLLAQYVIAATSPDSILPNQTAVQSIILHTWKWQNADDFYSSIQQLQLANPLVCAKLLSVYHQVLLEAQPSITISAMANSAFLENIRSFYVKAMSDVPEDMSNATTILGMASVIKAYSEYVVKKLKFHSQNPNYEGNYSMDSYIVTIMEAGLSLNVGDGTSMSKQVVAQMLELLSDSNSLAKLIFSHESTKKACVSVLMSLMKESYELYLITTYLLSKLDYVEQSYDLKPIISYHHGLVKKMLKWFALARNTESIAASVPPMPAAAPIISKDVALNIRPPVSVLPSTKQRADTLQDRRNRGIVAPVLLNQALVQTSNVAPEIQTPTTPQPQPASSVAVTFATPEPSLPTEVSNHTAFFPVNDAFGSTDFDTAPEESQAPLSQSASMASPRALFMAAIAQEGKKPSENYQKNPFARMSTNEKMLLEHRGLQLRNQGHRRNLSCDVSLRKN
eukprot:TRINITY_DN5010_c0_g1_i1.p1 TRINITY_DN5010_c0_g1~~TRINITY_DN5010_c0_g1_i1.p1  ORF type:complete len:926 (+),score=176.67 TRINITY_DN5010_c0_g1_i1:282-3059(+)